MTDRYAVMGNPIAHSKSPLIHACFAEQTGEDLSYTAIQVEPGLFPAAVAEFQAAGGRGLNITVPFKEEAFALATSHSPRAARARAVNTLLLRGDNDILGDNTDGPGLVNDLTRNQGFLFSGTRVLVLGAGGAVRGVLGPILDTGPRQVVIANRTAKKAEILAAAFSGGVPVLGGGYAALRGEAFDLIINGTAASLQGDLPPLPEGILAGNGWCYDMMYGAEATPFQKWALQRGAARALDGLGMLVEQAAESFLLWRGVRPETQSVIRAVREAVTR